MYKILVVDDNHSQVDLICAMLARLNIKCISAYSGEEAVMFAKSCLPDVIIMDWVMPAESLTGNDATQQILSDHTTRHIPVIACSAVIEHDQISIAGCVAFIPKPFKLDNLLNIVRTYLP
jgi:CheY-like chemotaxis protein